MLYLRVQVIQNNESAFSLRGCLKCRLYVRICTIVHVGYPITGEQVQYQLVSAISNIPPPLWAHMSSKNRHLCPWMDTCSQKSDTTAVVAVLQRHSARAQQLRQLYYSSIAHAEHLQQQYCSGIAQAQQLRQLYDSGLTHAEHLRQLYYSGITHAEHL